MFDPKKDSRYTKGKLLTDGDHTVPPGTMIEISVDLIAPTEGGKYTGKWALKNADGDHFGIGLFKNPIYVEIKVLDPLATSTDAPVFTDTPVP